MEKIVNLVSDQQSFELNFAHKKISVKRVMQLKFDLVGVQRYYCTHKLQFFFFGNLRLFFCQLKVFQSVLSHYTLN